MDRSEDNLQAKVRVREATNWFELSDSRLYEIDYHLWIHQENLATLRGAVHTMRSELSANVGAYLRGDNDQTRYAHTDNTLDHDRSHAQRLNFPENSESNGVVGELVKAPTSNLNEVAVHVTEHRLSTASDTNAPDADVGACEAAGCTAHIQQLQSAVLMGPAKRAKLTEGCSEKQRIGLRRSPRHHRQA